MGESWKEHVVFTKGAHVQEICSPLKEIGIDGFFFTRILPNGQFIDLATDLHWTEAFLENYFDEKYDFKTVKSHMAIESNIDLWSVDPSFIHTHTKAFGIKDGISIKFTHPKWQDVFSYYIHDESDLTAHDLINLIDILRKFSEYFLETATDLISIGQKTPLIVPQKYLNSLQPHQQKFSPQLNKILQQLTDKNLNLPGFQTLSTREKLCIEHAKKGLSSELIGKKMCLSKRTVESYLVSARDKTNCKNLTELVYQYNFIKHLL